MPGFKVMHEVVPIRVVRLSAEARGPDSDGRAMLNGNNNGTSWWTVQDSITMFYSLVNSPVELQLTPGHTYVCTAACDRHPECNVKHLQTRGSDIVRGSSNDVI